MELRHLRQIVAIDRHHSFAKAATDLGVSQPTLSKSIARVEDELGVRLFERSAAGTAITPLGAHIVARAERMLADGALLDREIALMSAGEHGEVRIGAGSVLASSFLPRFVTELTKLFPKLAIRVTVGPRLSVMDGLRRGVFDIAFAADDGRLDEDEFRAVPLGSEPIVAVAAPNHPLVGEAAISGRQLIGFPLATSSVTHPFELRRVLRLHAEEADGIAYLANDYATIKALALAGAAVGLGPRHTFHDECAAGTLVELDIEIDFRVSFLAIMTHAAANWTVLRGLTTCARGVADGFLR